MNRSAGTDVFVECWNPFLEMVNMNPPELLPDRLLRLTEEDPDFVCGYFLDWLDDRGRPCRLTRQEWTEKAKRIGSALRENGVKFGDRVLLSLPTSPQFLISFLALWWIGAIPVPLPEVSPFMKKQSFLDRFSHVAQDCMPQGIIALEFGKKILEESGDLGSRIPVTPIWSFESLWEIGDGGYPRIQQPERPKRSDVAFIQYTSGSTASPKGVVVTHENLSANMEASGVACRASTADKFMSWIPLYHDMGLVGSMLWTSYWKMPFYLMSPLTFLADPAKWIENISRYQATLSIAPNFAYSLCARRLCPEQMNQLDLSSWRLAFNGSEAIDYESLSAFIDKFGPHGFSTKAFYPVYGMAEATLAISFPEPGTEFIVDAVDREQLIKTGRAVAVGNTAVGVSYFVSSGYPLPGHSVAIKDPENEKILGERELGEICCCGPSITPRYFHETSNTRSRQELRTGDLGYIADGAVYVVDRIKDLVQIAGVNYYPSDIERCVQKIPGIKPGRVVAVGVPNSKIGTESLVILAEIQSDVDQNELRQRIRSTIIKTFGISPADFVLSQERIIPLTSSGKLMRRACKESYLLMRQPTDHPSLSMTYSMDH